MLRLGEARLGAGRPYGPISRPCAGTIGRQLALPETLLLKIEPPVHPVAVEIGPFKTGKDMTPGAGQPRLDVVIPARSETSTLPRCLRALLCDSHSISLKVIVVANGPDCAATAQSARATTAAFETAGQELTVLEQLTPGKTAALNLGDLERRGCAVAYLDADVVILPGTLQAIAERLNAASSAILVCPPLHVVTPRRWPASHYAAVWSARPAATTDVIGAGCYAVNAAGRRRWGVFPNIIADDAFACSHFEPHERELSQKGGIYFCFPDGWDLLAMRRRWHKGKVELRKLQQPPRGAGTRKIGGRLAAIAPLKLWLALPTFAAVTLFARAQLLPDADRRRVGAPGERGWLPVRPEQGRLGGYQGKPGVHGVVVTHNSRSDITRCLLSLESQWADLQVTIVDNASTDGTPQTIARDVPDARLFSNETNAGFAQAVNTAVAQAEGFEFVLLVNPDAVLRADTIDALLALAMRFPNAGLYGGRMSDLHGALDSTSCLARPSVWQAMAFGLGLSVIRGAPVLDPDSLGGWARTGTREVPVLTAGCLLISAELWRRLGGFDPVFFLYGEDVDLCLRARTLGARPMFTDYAAYAHKGGGSSASSAHRMVLILHGKATLIRKHMGRRSAAFSLAMLSAGVALRAALEAVTGRKPVVWKAVWSERASWSRGWPG